MTGRSGINIMGGLNIITRHNQANGNQYGIEAVHTNTSFFFNNTCFYNGWMFQATDRVLEHNYGTGIDLIASYHNDLLNNTLSYNSWAGARLQPDTGHNTIQFNYFDRNLVTIYDNGTSNYINSNYYSAFFSGFQR